MKNYNNVSQLRGESCTNPTTTHPAVWRLWFCYLSRVHILEVSIAMISAPGLIRCAVSAALGCMSR